MPDPLCAFVGQGAALTAAAWAAAAANADGGGPFQRLGEGRGAALREAWTAEAVRTVPAERRAAAGDADELFAYARPPTKRERLEKGERRAEQHQGWADAPKEKRRRAAEEQTRDGGAGGAAGAARSIRRVFRPRDKKVWICPLGCGGSKSGWKEKPAADAVPCCTWGGTTGVDRAVAVNSWGTRLIWPGPLGTCGSGATSDRGSQTVLSVSDDIAAEI